ncbi:MAG: nitroreductase family protein [Muribaculaceae bacterium]|nr:nitroreductase family protein [Muribaculaceae bacterium]
MRTDRYNEFVDLLSERYACRVYDSEKSVSREQILAVIEAARLAPSAKNKQPWSFIVLESPEDRAVVTSCYGRDWISKAPVCIVACAHHDSSWRRADGKDHADIDLAIAGEHICLAATSLGLASCWVCNFNAMSIAEALALPEGVEPVAIFPLGYQAEGIHVPEKSRRLLEDIVRWGR